MNYRSRSNSCENKHINKKRKDAHISKNDRHYDNHRNKNEEMRKMKDSVYEDKRR